MLPEEKYHLFNHANGRENIFIEPKNYAFFLQKLAIHILPVCKLFSYCLMSNHFHLFLEVRNEEELFLLWQKSNAGHKLKQLDVEHKISKSFGNFFSSYAQSFNKIYNRKGSLFIPSMKTEEIKDDNYFYKVIHYAHANPVHHGFTKTIEDWPHSCYEIFFSTISTKLERDYVFNMFGGLNAFIKYHQQPIDLKNKFLE